MVSRQKAMCVLLGLMSLCLTPHSVYAASPPDNPLIAYLNDIKKAVVFLGVEDERGRPHFVGTGVLLSVKDILHVATARHVVQPPMAHNLSRQLVIFFNTKDGHLGRRSVEDIQKLLGVDWIFHPDPHVDLAMIPFAMDPKRDDVNSLAESLFLTADSLYETAAVFFMSYQPNSLEASRVTPVFRAGIVSQLGGDGTFLIDATAFPGNSGGPVFIRPEPVSFGQGGIRLGISKLSGRFIGIVGEYITYHEWAFSLQTQRRRVLFEENTGLSRVWSVDYILEIIRSPAFRRQLREIETRFPRQKQPVGR